MEDHQLDIRYALQVKRSFGWSKPDMPAPKDGEPVLEYLDRARSVNPREEYRIIRVNPPSPTKEKTR